MVVSMPTLRLAGLTEVAQLLGASKRTATRYATSPDFPEPVAKLAMGLVWLVDDIEDWAKRRGTIRPGRPQKCR
jgi:predicted DNA-binding transcriptional regulator AlpA